MARRFQYIDGIDKVRRVFRDLPDEARFRIADAINRGLDDIAEAAYSIAPESGDSGTRAVKNTIKPLREFGIINRTGKGGINRPSVVGYVIAGDTAETANAAWRQEYGRNPGGGGKVDMSAHPGHDPQEFMWPAYWTTRTRTRGRIKRAINAAVKDVARRAR